MPSNDDRTTERTKPGLLTGREGDELEPIMDPAGSYHPDELPAGAVSAADAVDDLLSDDGGSNGNGSDGGHRGLEDSGELATAAFVEPTLSGGPSRATTRGDDLEPIVRSQRTSKLRLGDLLKEMGLVTDEQVGSALGRQKETRKRLGQLLLEDGVVTQLDLTKALAQKFGVSFLDLTSTRFDGAATAYIDEKLARRYGAVPVRFLNNNASWSR